MSENNKRMAAKDDKEKEKFTRESLSKYFFDMSRSTYTIMVLGGLAAFFGIVQSNKEDTITAILLGVVLTVILSLLGFIISKKK